jgi:DMSO/TMAO reductase YedYZ molybdopterin-dependent catalytic subunit
LVLDLAGMRPEARYVVFEPFANPNQSGSVVRVLWDSIDVADARHAQTLLAYAMNGDALPVDQALPCACAWDATSATRTQNISLVLS